MIYEAFDYIKENPGKIAAYAGVLAFWATVAYVMVSATITRERTEESKRLRLEDLTITSEDNL